MPCDLILVLDAPSVRPLVPVLKRLAGTVRWAKVGLELFTAEGPDSVREVAGLGFEVFLDLKLHDIPETVERAVGRACALGAKLLTVHASGGAAMLERAVARAQKEATGLEVVAVTVLTSLDDADLEASGIAGGVATHALRLARLSWSAGVRAFVSSPHEVARMRAELGPTAILITPGIRSSTSRGDDQKRVATAGQAIRDGADWLVVGRPIRDAGDPRAAALALQKELTGARAHHGNTASAS